MNDLIKVKKVNSIKEILETKDQYFYQVKTWIKWMDETGEGINEDGIRNYFTWLNETTHLVIDRDINGKIRKDAAGNIIKKAVPYKAKTISIKRSAVKKRVKQIYKQATTDDRIRIDRILLDLDDGVTAAPKVNSIEITPDKVLSPVEYGKLMDSCRTERQQMFIYFLYTTGARVTEMINIKFTDCKIIDSTVKMYVMGKGRKERYIRIPLQMYKHIRNTFEGENYLFETSQGKPYHRCYVSQQIHKIGLRINRNISAHTLRHSFATRKIQQLPGKIDAVSKYLGHSSVSTTMNLYVHTQMTDNELFDEAI